MADVIFWWKLIKWDSMETLRENYWILPQTNKCYEGINRKFARSGLYRYSVDLRPATMITALWVVWVWLVCRPMNYYDYSSVGCTFSLYTYDCDHSSVGFTVIKTMCKLGGPARALFIAIHLISLRSTTCTPVVSNITVANKIFKVLTATWNISF